ncbi:MAG: hypothetical protein IJH43_04645, partial [Mogibacterium sp.]|nr:hypothetical protein [Mogibacterium sp.]
SSRSNCIMAMSNKSFLLRFVSQLPLYRKKGVLLIFYAEMAQPPEIQVFEDIFNIGSLTLPASYGGKIYDKTKRSDDFE